MHQPDTCPSEQTLRNLAALARFANPYRLPLYPRHRRPVLMRLAWGVMRIPHQRAWSD